jgi:hypothetical protein
MTTIYIVSIAYDIGFEAGVGLGKLPDEEIEKIFHELLDSWLSDGDISEGIQTIIEDEDDKYGLFLESALKGLREGSVI